MLILGCGGIAQCALPLIIDLIDIPASNITIIDFVDQRARVSQALEQGVTYIQDRLNKENYHAILSQYLKAGDILVDLAWNIDTCLLLDWCHNHNVLFINTSVEQWEPYHNVEQKNPTELTLYARQMAIRKLVATWDKKGATAMVDHGANPGLVSHFTKQALVEIAQEILHKKPTDQRRKALEQALQNKNFAMLAQLVGVKTIHISERDTQITSQPKRVNEFVNTWSIEGLIEEGMAPSELGWGTHEKTLPKGALQHTHGPQNQICLSSMGINTKVRSWVPSGPIIGMAIRHGEAFSISDYLTVWENEKAVYRPTVHYAYCPSDGTIASLLELRMRNFVTQPQQRIMNDDIIDGVDELGCLLMGHDFGAWWIGSVLDVTQARRLAPGQNSTSLQVAISAVAAIKYMLDNPELGFCLPDQFDHEAILAVAKPYLGTFISQASDWTPLKSENQFFTFGKEMPSTEDVWQFSTFLVRNDIY